MTMKLLSDLFLSFRSFFLLVHPDEAFHENGDPVDTLHYAIPVFVIMVACEAFAYQRMKMKESFRVNDAITSMMGGLCSRLWELFSFTLELIVYQYVHKHFAIMSLGVKEWHYWFLAMFAIDCCYYFFHRAAHEVNFMWSYHQMHHSSEYYNLSTALRQGMFQQMTSFLFYTPVALFFTPQAAKAHFQINILYQFWIHTEIISTLGPLEWIMNTPSHHRVHHGRNPYCIDKNYAGIFIIWDRLFGTFTPERSDEKIQYGLVHNYNTFNMFTLQMAQGWHVFKTVWTKPGIIGKLKYLLYGPGYNDEKPQFRLGDNADIPHPDPKEPKYNPSVHPGYTCYAAWKFLVMLIVYGSVAGRYQEVGFVKAFSCFAMIVTSFTFMGMMLDGRKQAKFGEMLVLGWGIVTCFAIGDTIPVLLAAYLQMFSVFFVVLLVYADMTDHMHITRITKQE